MNFLLSTAGIVMMSSLILASTAGEREMITTAHHLDIFGLTNELVDVTNSMMSDTAELSQKMGEVGYHLSMLDVQKAELAKQVITNDVINDQLTKQLLLNKEARELMQNILTLQGNTANLTSQVVMDTTTVTNQVMQSADYLTDVAVTTGSLSKETNLLMRKLDELNGELDVSAESFRFVGRLSKLGHLLPANSLDSVRNAQLPDVTKSIQNLLPVPGLKEVGL